MIANFRLVAARLLIQGLCLLPLAGCRSDPEPAHPVGSVSEETGVQERQSVQQAIEGMIGWAQTMDFDRLLSTVAHDSSYLEVHPRDNVVRGFEEFREGVEIFRDPAFKAVRYQMSDLQITFSRSGDVAWFYCVLDDINEWDGQPFSWIGVRWTGVLEKREGRWRMAQMHFSSPVAG